MVMKGSGKMTKKGDILSHETYLKKLKEKNIKTIPKETYKGAKTKIKHKCICGTIWKVNPSNVLYGRTCGCSRGKKKLEHKSKVYLKTLQEKNIHVLPLEKYKGRFIKILHRCTCKNEWLVTPSDVLDGKFCGCKRGNKTWTHKRYLLELKERKITIEPQEKYIDNNTPIKHICLSCEKTWNSSPSKIIRKETMCCNRKSKTWNQNRYIVELEKKNINVRPAEDYIKANVKIKHICICGNEWSVTPNNVLSGKTCGCSISKGENIINDYLKEIKCDFLHQYCFNDFNKYRYDFAIFKNNKIACLVEFHGKQHFDFVLYWHKDLIGFAIQLERDQKKRDFAKEKGIPLIEITYKEKDVIGALERELEKLGIGKGQIAFNL